MLAVPVVILLLMLLFLSPSRPNPDLAAKGLVPSDPPGGTELGKSLLVVGQELMGDIGGRERISKTKAEVYGRLEVNRDGGARLYVRLWRDRP
jgi:hypothetical protein